MVSDRRFNPIGNFRFRLGCVLAARQCLRFCFTWIMVWAAVAVGLRAVFRVDPLLLLWGIAGIGVAVAVGIVMAVRSVPSASVVRAVMDRQGDMGGLLMAAGDLDIGPWDRRIASAPAPTLRWRPGRQVLLLVASVAFLIATLLAPDRYLPSNRETALQIGGEIEKITEKLQILKEEDILPPEKVQVLEKDLDRIRQEAEGRDPAKTMEALDHLEQSFCKEAAEAAESAIQQTERVGQTQELAEALGQAQDQLDPRRFGEAMKELARMAEQAAAENELLADGLSDDFQESCQEGCLSDEQLRELAEALKNCKACERAKIVKLINARLIDAGALKRCDRAGECDPEELLLALCECEDCEDLAALLACGGLPGRGGINRGRADAAMTWQNGVEKEDAAFQEKVLPPGAVASLKESRLAGLSAADPTAAEPGGGSSGGALGAAQAGGGEAHAQTILPEHAKTVQRYFSREKQ